MMNRNVLKSCHGRLKQNLATALIATLALLSPLHAFAANVLLLSEPCGASAQYAPTALTNLGHTTTQVATWADFNTQLATPTSWDLVIVDSYGNYATDDVPLTNFINAGGNAIVSYWAIDGSPNLATALEATVVSTLGTPLTIQVWDASSPLFTTPRIVGDQTPVADTCTTDGQRLNPVAPATAPAGYTPATAANEAAIISGNSGKTLLFGFTPGLYDVTMVDLYENAITNVLNPPADPTPTPSGDGGGGAEDPTWLLLAAMASVYLRRRQTRQ